MILHANKAVFFTILALLFVVSSALHTDKLTASFPLTLSGDECKEIFTHLFMPERHHHHHHHHGDEMCNYNDETDNITVLSTYDTSFRYPTTNLQWVNFTNTRIMDWDFRSCTVEHDLKEHCYTIRAIGVDARIEGDFAYSCEYDMPVTDDDGSYAVFISNTTILARVQRFPVYDQAGWDKYQRDFYRYQSQNRYRHHYNRRHLSSTSSQPPSKPTPNEYIWRAFTTTWIPHMVVNTSDTEHSEFYDKFAKDHDAELRILLSLVANKHISGWLNHYCAEHDCDDEELFNSVLQHVLYKYNNDFDSGDDDDDDDDDDDHNNDDNQYDYIIDDECLSNDDSHCDNNNEGDECDIDEGVGDADEVDFDYDYDDIVCGIHEYDDSDDNDDNLDNDDYDDNVHYDDDNDDDHYDHNEWDIYNQDDGQCSLDGFDHDEDNSDENNDDTDHYEPMPYDNNYNIE